MESSNKEITVSEKTAISDYFQNNNDYDFENYSLYVKNPRVNISEVDFEKLTNTNDWLDYSKAVFHNQKNQKRLKLIKIKWILTVIANLLYYLALLIAIPSYINQTLLFDPAGIFLFVTLGLNILLNFYTYPDFVNALFVGRHSFIGTPENEKYHLPKTLFFVSEFLKCQYEVVNNLTISEERSATIKKYFNSYYYLINKKKNENDTKTFKNKNFNERMGINEKNYISKFDLIGRFIRASGYVFFFLVNLNAFIIFISLLITYVL